MQHRVLQAPRHIFYRDQHDDTRFVRFSAGAIAQPATENRFPFPRQIPGPVGKQNIGKFILCQITIYLFCMQIFTSCYSSRFIEEPTKDGPARYKVHKNVFSKKTTLHGIYILWHHNGTKRLETNYKNGKKHGSEIQWDAFGNKLRQTTFVRGLREGIEIYWNENGCKRKEVSYKSNKQHGMTILYFPDGKREMEEVYKNNSKNGPEITYDKDGRKVHQVEYVDGKKNGTEFYYMYSAGGVETVSEIQWRYGTVVSGTPRE